LNTNRRLVLILAMLFVAGFDMPELALAHFQQSDCPALVDINIIHPELAEARFEPFEGDDILFFGNIDANLDTIYSRENGEQLYCDYLVSRLPIFPADTPISTYLYLGTDYRLTLTENGADIFTSREQTPDPEREDIRIPDRWFSMTQLIALMTGRDRMEGASASDPHYTIDELMAEARVFARTYIYAKLWDANTKAWKADPTKILPIVIVAESFGTVFARTFLVALAERMTELGYEESAIQEVWASIRFIAIGDIVPPFALETGSFWALLEAIPTLSVIHANEDYARYFGGLTYYEDYVPLDSEGNLTEGIWQLAGEHYLYVKVALDQANVHGVEATDLARDPIWLSLWEHIRNGTTLREALGLATRN
jgi:hypothetical protein